MSKRKKKLLHRPAPASGVRETRSTGAGAAGVEAAVRRGAAAFQRGDYVEAVEAWRSATRLGAPSTVGAALAEAYFRRALNTANPARRAQDLQEAATLAPDHAVYHFHLGLAYHRQGQVRRAIAAYEAAHQLASNDERVRRQLALAFLGTREDIPRARDLVAGLPQTDEAAARLRALVALRENNPVAAVAALTGLESRSPIATVALGVAQLVAGQAAAARSTTAQLPEHNGDTPGTIVDVAALVGALTGLQTGDPSGAAEMLRSTGLPHDPVLRRAYSTVARRLAAELVLDERLDDAAFVLAAARDLAPGDPAIERCLAHLEEVLGTRAARAGSFVLAADYWKRALDARPGDVRLLQNLALAEERLERWNEASAHWEELAHRWKKEQQSGRGDQEAAAALRQRLIVAHRHLAETYDAAGDTRQAARALERALNLEPSNTDLQVRAGELHLEGGNYGGAIEHFRRALAARPRDVQLLVELGSAYDLKGDERQAFRHLEEALSLEPENAAAKAALGSVHHARGHRFEDSNRVDEAIAEYETAAKLAPGDSEHYRCLGDLYLRLKRLKDAKATFKRALDMQPDNPLLRVTIGGLYLAHDSRKQAESLFQQALRLDNQLVVQMAIGFAYLQNGDFGRASKYLRHTLDGSEPLLIAGVGGLLIDCGLLAEAIPYFERAIELDPTLPEVRLELAYAIAFGRGDYARAAAEIERAGELAGAQGKRNVLDQVAAARRLNAQMAEGPLPLGSWFPEALL